MGRRRKMFNYWASITDAEFVVVFSTIVLTSLVLLRWRFLLFEFGLFEWWRRCFLWWWWWCFLRFFWLLEFPSSFVSFDWFIEFVSVDWILSEDFSSITGVIIDESVVRCLSEGTVIGDEDSIDSDFDCDCCSDLDDGAVQSSFTRERCLEWLFVRRRSRLN
jgi:hypothetical protein